MSFTFAVISDLHYGAPGSIAQRRGELAAILLRRAVERFNRFVQPQLVVLLGDLINDHEVSHAMDDLRELRAICDRLDCPYLAIPGNHDPAPDLFYTVMPRPEPVFDIGPARFVSFTDAEEPGWHARRNEQDLARLRGARSDGFAGPLVTLQHVPVMPRGREMRYSYTNLDEVLAANAEGGVNVCLGGHVHQASPLVREGGTHHLAFEALCEAPHPYTLVTLEDDGQVTIERQTLAMPASYGLIDLHSHTHLAYCAEDVQIERSAAVAHATGLRGLALTEHSGHLYFNRGDFRSGRLCDGGIASAQSVDERVESFFQQVRQFAPPLPIYLGMEIDVDFRGQLIIRPDHAEALDWKVGAIHFLPADAQGSDEAFVAGFRDLTEKLCGSGIDALAHPFRIFRRQKRDVPQTLYPWLLDVLKRSGVAAEINFHTNEPHPSFVRMCLESGVPLTFGSDSHALWEVGEFFGHLRLLEQLGVHGDPSRYLASPAAAAVGG